MTILAILSALYAIVCLFLLMVPPREPKPSRLGVVRKPVRYLNSRELVEDEQ